jgi:hypothetical protein
MASFRDRAGERLRQIRLAFSTTRASDPRLVPYMLLAAIVGLAVPLALFIWLGQPVAGVVGGLVLGAAAAISVLGIRSQRVAIARIEGQPGAALAVLQSLRGAWIVTPTVAFSGKQDLVHRVVGRPGVILVGEGRRARVQALLRQTSRKTARVAGDVLGHLGRPAWAASTPDGGHQVRGVVGSGWLNMNPTVVDIHVRPDGRLTVHAAAKEGPIRQKTAPKAVRRVIEALYSAAPPS